MEWRDTIIGYYRVLHPRRVVLFSTLVSIGVLAGSIVNGADYGRLPAIIGSGVFGCAGLSIVDDILDSVPDRFWERNRPLADGIISRQGAGIIAGLCVIGATICVLYVPRPAQIVYSVGALAGLLYAGILDSIPGIEFRIRVLLGGIGILFGSIALTPSIDSLVLSGAFAVLYAGAAYLTGETAIP